jgi:hypothetical protein
MRLARSTDGGRSWLPTVTLNDDSARGPGSHTFHGAAWEGDSTLVVAWLDERVAPGTPSPAPHAGHTGAGSHPAPDDEADATVFLARSRDLGATWAPSNEAKWGAACPCCRVALARRPGGDVVAAWRKHFPGGVRDIVAGPLSGDDSSHPRIHADDWVYPGCPHTGPSVAVDGRGVAHLAWYTGKPDATGIRYARSDAAAPTRFGAATFLLRGTIPTAHVAVAGLPSGGSVIASDRDQSGATRLVVAAIGPDGRAGRHVVLASSTGADHPSIAALSDRDVLVAWTRQSDAGSRMVLTGVRLSDR